MKSKKVIFSLFVMLYALSSSAYDALIDGIYYNFEGTSAIVTNSGSTGCYQGDIVIPSSVTYNGNLYSVTSIGENSFYSCTNLTSVTISEGVKGIDKYAFSWCGKLMRVTIPFSVKNIGESAFSNCSGVIDVVNCNIPDCTWNTVEASYFPTGIFCGSNIRELVLGEDVTYIGNSAFAGCKQLVSLTCKAQKVPTLGTFVFAGGGGTWYHNSNVPLSEATLYVPASSLEAYRNADQWKEFGTILPIDETQIPSATSISLNQTEATMEIGTTLQLTATILPKEAVQTAEWSSSDASIASVNSNGVVTAVSSGTATITAKTTDGSNLTARCAVTVDELDPTVLIAGECGNGVTYSLNASGVLTFSGSGTINFDSNNRPWREYLNQIKIIIIPEGVTSICSYAFRDCKSLTSITLPSSLRTISDHAFVNCEGLTELVIPEGVESIGEYAFEGLKNLQSAKLPSSIQSLGKEIFKNSTGTVYVKCNIPDARWGGEHPFYNAKFGKVVIEEGVESIGNHAFRWCSSITSLTFPSTLKSIGEEAFGDCSGLTELTLPSNIETLGNRAFGGCGGVVYLNCNLPDTNDGIFRDSKITRLVVGNGVTSLGQRSFCNSSQLASITLPSTLKVIGSYAFEGCKSLPSITIPSSVRTILDHAFVNCEGLTELVIPEGVESIGEYAFEGLKNLQSAKLPSSIQSLGKEIFKNSTGTVYVKCNIPDARWGGEHPFYNAKFGKVVIEEGVESIGNHAFRWCSSITSLTFPSTLKSIGEEAFGDCSGLTDVYCYAENAPETGNNAFTSSAVVSTTLHVPVTGMSDYRSTTPWSYFSDIVTLEGEVEPEFFAYVDGIRYSFASNYATVIASDTKYTGKVVIPASVNYNGKSYIVTSIGENAFRGCSGISTIVIPKVVWNIQKNAFNDCTFQTMMIRSSAPPTLAEGSLQGIKGTVYVPEQGFQTYKSKWPELASIIMPYEIVTTSLPSNKWSRAEYYVSAIAFDAEDDYGSSSEDNPKYNVIVGTPQKDAQGKEWYAHDYQCNWELRKAPLNRWCNHYGDIYARRLFCFDDELPTEIFLACGHDDAPCEYYLNGELIFSNSDGWYENEMYQLTSSQKALIKNGELNVLSFHVHQNWGGMYADSGLYPDLSKMNISYQCGDNVSWNLEGETGMLVISGTGRMNDFWGYDNRTNAPWTLLLNGIKYVEIKSGVTSIGSSAFEGCGSLTSVNISNSVTSIGSNAFKRCFSLTDIYCYSEILPSTYSNVFDGTPIASATLHVPEGSVNLYKETAPWSQFGSIVAIGDEGEEQYENVVLNGSIIGQWNIVSGTVTRYENGVQVSQEGGALTSPYDRIAFYNNGAVEFLEYSSSNNSYHEDGNGTYTIVNNKFIYGGGDWDSFIITAFDGSNTMEVYFQFSENKSSKIVRKVYRAKLQRVTDGGDDPTPAGEFLGAKRIFADNLLKSFTYDYKTFTYHYDSRGFVTQIDRNSSGSVKTYTISYGDKITFNCTDGTKWVATLNSSGFVGSMVCYNSKGEERDRTVFTYNADDQLTGVNYDDDEFYNITYSGGDITQCKYSRASGSNYSWTYSYGTSGQDMILNSGNVMEFDNIYGVDLDDYNLLYYIGALGKATKHLPLAGVVDGSTTTGTWVTDAAGRATQGTFNDHTLTWNWGDNSGGQGGEQYENVVLNGSIIGQWNIVSGTVMRYENGVQVSQEGGALTSPYDRFAFYDNGAVEFLEYSNSNSSYHEDGNGTYTIVNNKFVYGSGDWDSFIITAFDGSNNMEIVFRYSDSKGYRICRANLLRVTDSGDDPSPAGEFQGAKRIFGDNLLKSSTNDDKTFTYHYDNRGFVTQIDRIRTDGSGKTYTISYGDKITFNCSDGTKWVATLNSNGFVGSMVCYKANGNESDRAVFSYNADNQLTRVTYDDDEFFNITYSGGDITSCSFSRASGYSESWTYSYGTSGQDMILNSGNVMEFDNIFGVDLDDYNLLYYIGALGKATKHLPLAGVVDGSTTTGTWVTDAAGRATKALFSNHTFTWNWDDNGGQGGDDTGDNIIFADANVKALCVQNWDTNGDGELSKAEAAAVTSIGKVFYLAKITSFDELRYFTGLTAIDEQAFFQSDITSVIIPNGVTSIGKSAFSYCGDLTSLTLPDRLSTIEVGAFFCCRSLASLYIPRGLASISYDAFQACDSISTIIVAPENTVYDSRDNCNAIVRKSDNTIIYGCKNTVIPTTVAAIGYGAFWSNDELTNVTIPDNVTLIDSYSYSNCDNLQTVTIGSGIKEIKNWAFRDCNSLKDFYCYATTPPSTGSLAFWYLRYDKAVNANATLHVPEGSVNLYKSTAPWSGFGRIVAIGEEGGEDPEDDNCINGIYYSFSNNNAEVTYKDENYNTYTGDVVIPSTVKYHGDTYTVTSINTRAFRNCTGLTSVFIPETVSTIQSHTFEGCSSLSSVTLPDNLSQIQSYAFCYCSSLSSITIPSNVAYIGGYAFSGCNMTTITIPKSVMSISERCPFSGCSRLTSIKVEDGNTVYDSRNNCNAIIETATNVLIAGCKNTIIPEEVTKVGEMAFYGCSGMTDLYCYARNVPETASNAFTNSPITSATLHVPASSVNLYKSTAPWSGFGSIVAIGDDVEDPNPLLYGTWRYDFDTNSYILLTFSQAETVRYQEYDRGRWQSDEVYSYSFSNNALKITDSNGNVKGVIEVLTLTSTTLKLNGWPDGGVSTFIKQNGSDIESAVLNGSIIGQWNIVSGTVTRYENGVQVSQEGGAQTSPYDRIAFYNNGAVEFLEYSSSNNSYHEDGNGTYTIVDNKFVYGSGDWDSFIITAFDGSNNMEVYFQFSEDKGSTFVKKVYYVNLQRVTEGEDEQEYQTDNTLAFADNLKANAGTEFNLPIEMTNRDAISGIQFDLYLPEGVELCKDEYEDYLIEMSRTTARRHSIASRVMNDGALRVVISSTQNSTFTGNSGQLLSLVLLPNSTLEAGNYEVELKNIVLTDPDANRYAVADVKGYINVRTYTMGDVNNDGYIDVADLAGVVRFILENADASLVFNAADMDGNGVVEINDYAALVNVILNQSTPSAAPQRKVKSMRNTLVTLSDYRQNTHGEGELMVHIGSNGMQYTGMQLDLGLPEGIELMEDGAEAVSNQHETCMQKLANGKYRVVCASIMNDELPEGNVVRLKLRVVGDVDNIVEVMTDNIVLSDANAIRYEASPANIVIDMDEATGIGSLNTTLSLGEDTVYDLAGRRVNSQFIIHNSQLPRRIYIHKGKKVSIK